MRSKDVAPRTHRFRIVAQDPSVLDLAKNNGEFLTAFVEVPYERLRPGPWGYRLNVIDYDSSAHRYARPRRGSIDRNGFLTDLYANRPADKKLANDAGFMAQNVYLTVMHTLARFERALGRRVNWTGDSHQLKVAPRGFAAANAFYAREAEALVFGYFPDVSGQTIYTSLSYDVVVHEATHALLDAMHSRYMDPSSADQAAFHEGFADIVALLSVFSLPEVVANLLRNLDFTLPCEEPMKPTAHSDLLSTRLKETGIFGLAEQIGGELPHRRGAYTALRNSVRDDELGPGIYEREDGAFRESHRRGEILVAAVLNAFVSVWARRALIGFEASDMLCDRSRLVEEGVDAASELLTMAIRALDYMPPVHILFTDFLSAILTADGDLRPDDSRYHLRNELRRWFKYYGIVPGGGDPVPSQGGPTRRFAGTVPIEEGFWAPVGELPITYHGAHFEPLARDPNEVFRFIWENQQTLKLKGNLNDASFMKVLWVRPCVRTAPDGFVIQNTVSEFYQSVHLRAGELKTYDIRKPTGMPDSTEVRLYGGGTLIFDEFGRLKYYIHNSLDNSNRQNKRLEELWMRGAFRRGSAFNDLNEVHRMHMVDSRTAEEVW